METYDIEDTHEPGPVPVTPVTGAPKTMRELAEAVATEQEQQPDAPYSAIQTVPSSSSLRDRSSPIVGISNATQAHRNTTTTYSTTTTTTTTKVSNGKTKPRTRGTSATTSPAKSTPRRKRKRTRQDIDTSESEPETDDDDGEDPTIKRSRRASGVVQPPPIATSSSTVPKSDRVLRTRKQKTAAQLQEEKEQERAYRRAIA